MRNRPKSSAQQRGAAHSTSNFDPTTTADRPKSRSNDSANTHIHAAATAPATTNGNGLVRRAPTPPAAPPPPPPPPPPYHLLDHSHHPNTIEANSANVHASTNNVSHTSTPKPTAATPTTATVGAATPITTIDMNHNSTNHNNNNNKNADKSPIPNMTATAHSSLLQPRVAVALGVPKKWHFLLWLCRQSSTFPAIWWGLPSALRLLAMLHLIVFGGSPTTWQHIFARVVAAGVGRSGGGGGTSSTGTAGGGGDMGCGIGSDGGAMMMGSPHFLASGAGAGATGGGGSSSTSGGNANGNYNSYNPGASATGFSDLSFEARLRLTETLLAIVWCGASAYLSFFFTDSLMSRCDHRPAPDHNDAKRYLTSQILYLTAGSQDPRLLLPAWVGISAMLTLLYHITQRKINIRKETSMSIRAFSVASFISMVALLAQVHSNRTDYPQIPLWTFVTKVWQELVKVALKIMDYGTVARDY
ncbi:hypothetical protein B0T09DRAFT_410261 [Sordaria sp. MPI-SDFR-AT-0083]|nr:hypothetical protein B0T09DRAFT_410261 [Sordaria sp. MPI-SDFR-AT-0083]